MASLFLSVLTFRSANSCLNKSIDCSCSAFLAAAAFRLSLSASYWALSFQNASLVASLALSQCLSIFCRSSTKSFWSKEFVLFNFSNCAHWFYNSTSVCRARDRILAGARSSSVDTFQVRDRQDSTRYTPGEISEITFHNSGI